MLDNWVDHGLMEMDERGERATMEEMDAMATMEAQEERE